MKKIFQRLIVFFIGVPALLSLVVFFPQYNHLCLNIAVIVFSVLGAVELRNMLSKKNLVITVPEAVILGALGPAAWTAVVSFGAKEYVFPCAFILGASWLIVSKVAREKKIDSIAGHTVAGFALMIYPGLFLTWIIQMAELNEASMVILVFFLIAFMSDSMAWLAGVLFGKNNRGIIPVSPNKSVAGFIGGLFASLAVGVAAAAVLPDVFASQIMPSKAAGAILGFCAGLAATLGDLGESALKRSAGIKDSGSLIMGRGGALDTIDSIALAAPAYYIMYKILF